MGLDENLLNEAKEYYQKIKKNIRHGGGLYCFDFDGAGHACWDVYTFANATFGTLCQLIGEKEEASEIFDAINDPDKIGKKHSGLYYDGGGSSGISLDANASMGIFCLVRGKKKRAMEICKKINKTWEKEDGLYKGRKESSEKETHINALVGALSYILGKEEEARKLFKEINNPEKIGKGDNGLYKASTENDMACVYSTTAVAILGYLIGEKEEAKKLFNKMKKIEEHGLYIWSTLGILSYLLAGGKLL